MTTLVVVALLLGFWVGVTCAVLCVAVGVRGEHDGSR